MKEREVESQSVDAYQCGCIFIRQGDVDSRKALGLKTRGKVGFLLQLVVLFQQRK